MIWCRGGHPRPTGTLRPFCGQPFAVQTEIDRRKANAQPAMVLLDPRASHLIETEDAFHEAEHMLYFRPDARLRRILESGPDNRRRDLLLLEDDIG